MAYQADQDEAYYCGKCGQQYQPSAKNEKCCGYLTVSWRTSKESYEMALRRWKSVNGVS